MRFFRTKTDADSNRPSWRKLHSFIDTANPNYRGKYHLIHCWLIEFDEDDLPWREIGLDEKGSVVLAGPSKDDYGFWLDTHMRYADFVGEPITEEDFERMWAASGVIAP